MPRAQPTSPSRLALRRLADRGPSLEAMLVDGAAHDGRIGGVLVSPHRHDYHELIWTRRGTGRHLVDGEHLDVGPRSLTLIHRGQVHVFESANDMDAAIVRFGDELVDEGPAVAVPVWPVGATGARSLAVPADEVGRVESIIEALVAEASPALDGRSIEVCRHLLLTLLLWADRWHDTAGAERPHDADAAARLHRRFVRALERDFARHREVDHYADALGVAPSALARALATTTGRATKALIMDRVMLEAARLLRFTDLQVSEIAFRVGMADPLYFSRVFKRHYGESPLAYRRRQRSDARP